MAGWRVSTVAPPRERLHIRANRCNRAQQQQRRRYVGLLVGGSQALVALPVTVVDEIVVVSVLSILAQATAVLTAAKEFARARTGCRYLA